jgi:hypothetical protein
MCHTAKVVLLPLQLKMNFAWFEMYGSIMLFHNLFK